MPIIIMEDEGKLLNKKQVIVPDKLVNKLKLNKSLFGKYKNTKGFKRVSAIVDDDYNKRSDKKDRIHTDDKTISFSDLKRIDHDMRHTAPNPNNLEFILPGGNDMKNWAHDTLRKMRTSVKKVKAVPPVPKLQKEPTKPKEANKDIKIGNATVRLTEDIEYFYENYYGEYDVDYVFNQFLKNPNGKQDWGVLINPNMYAKALKEFTRFGKLTNSTFPSKYVYQWMGIIMKNTAILHSNTIISGHETYFPYEEFIDFIKEYFNDKRDVKINYSNDLIEIEISEKEFMCLYNGKNPLIKESSIDKYGQTYLPWITQSHADDIAMKNDFRIASKKLGEIGEYIEDFNNNKVKGFSSFGKVKIDTKTNKLYLEISPYNFLDEIGLYDWMSMPDGSDAWSDFGIEPLFKIIGEYDEDSTPEQTLVLVNRALDVYHQRGDMASIFIQGGSKALSKISENIKRKKVLIDENHLKLLKEYHNQQVFNFDTNGNAYFKKNNWEHYVDYLENIGNYGILPPSEWDKEDIWRAVEKIQDSTSIDEITIVYGYEIDDYILKDVFCNLVYESYFENNDYTSIFTTNFIDTFNTELPNVKKQIQEQPSYYYGIIESTLDDLNLTDYKNYFTSYGIEEFNEKIKDGFFNNMNYMGFPKTLTINDRGLIYIERNILIPNYSSPNFNGSSYEKKTYNDYYEHLTKHYNGIGTCFSWEKNRGEAYCGDTFKGTTATEIKLKCWVDPKDVDWKDTVLLNCYGLQDEQEIRVSDRNANIEVFEVSLNNGKTGNKILLNKPIIVHP